MAPARPPGHDIVVLAQAVPEVEVKMGVIESILAREEEFYAAQNRVGRRQAGRDHVRPPEVRAHDRPRR